MDAGEQPAHATDSRKPAPAPAPAPTPSPPWFGGLILSCLAIATAWTLTYTLAPLPGQKSLGGWNYAIVGVFLTFFIGLSMEWRGEPPEQSTDPQSPQQPPERSVRS